MTHKITVWLAACLTITVVACQSGTTSPKAKAKPVKNERLLDAVPAKAKAAVIIRRSALTLVDKMMESDAEMAKELGDFLTNRVGVDLTKVRGLVVFATELKPIPALAMFLRLDNAGQITLKGPPAGEHEGVKLHQIKQRPPVVAGVVSKGLVIGTRPGVEAAIARSKGKGKALNKDHVLGKLLDADGADVEVLIGVVSEGLPPNVIDAAERFGVDRAFFTMTTKQLLALRLGGNPQRLAIGKRLLVTGLKRKLAEAEEQKQKAVESDDPFTGAAAIAAYHQTKRFVAELEPKLVGNELISRFQLPRDPVYYAAAMAGVLAAVAIPSFIKYTRKAKTVEASESLDKMKAGARAYFQAEHYSTAGSLLPKTFPPGKTGWTPKLSCCAQGGKCEPDASVWTGSPWKELRFALGEPHYFQYRYQSTGENAGARFVIEARADMDCDGTFSSYRIMGGVDKESNVVTRGPIISNETE